MIEYQPLITAHRNVIWLADTNYRIDLDNETVRRHAEKDEYDALVAQDQVCWSCMTINRTLKRC